MRTSVTSAIAGAVVLGLLVNGNTYGANSDFQDFFFQACVDPTGDLARRCGETDDAEGNLSGDSESSLNPSQSLSNNDSGLDLARARTQESRKKNKQMREGEEMPDQGRTDIGPFSLLISGRITNTETDRKQDETAERGYEADGWAVNAGFDYRFNDRFVMGGLLGYGEGELEFDPENVGTNFTPAENAGDYDSESYSLIIFGSYSFTQQFYMEGSIGGASVEYDFERKSVFQESGRSVPQTNSITRGEADGDDYWLALSGGYYLHRGAWSFNPYAGVTWARSSVDGYRERDISGAGLSMRFSSVDRDSLVGALGVSISGAFNQNFGVLLPQLWLEYAHEFDRDPASVNATYVEDASQSIYRLTGDDPDEDFFNLGIGLMAIFPNGWIPFISYEHQQGDDVFEGDTFTVGLRKEL